MNPNNNETIFDKILSDKIPAQKVYEDEDVLAFHDLSPQAPVHVLVIPKKKIASFNDFSQMSPEQAGKYMQAIAKVAKLLKIDEDGYRVVFNCGKHGQQTVFYIHAHILGGRALTWPPG